MMTHIELVNPMLDETDSENERRPTQPWQAEPTKSSWTNTPGRNNGWTYSAKAKIRYSEPWLKLGVPVVREKGATDVTVEDAITLPGHMKLKPTTIDLALLSKPLHHTINGTLDKKHQLTPLQTALANAARLLQPLQQLADSRQLAIKPVVEFHSQSDANGITSDMPSSPPFAATNTSPVAMSSVPAPIQLTPAAMASQLASPVSAATTQALYYARGQRTDVTALLPFIHRHHNATSTGDNLKDQGFYVAPLPISFAAQDFTATHIAEGFDAYTGAICLLGYTVEGFCSGNPAQASVPIIKHSLAANLSDGAVITTVENSAKSDNAYEIALFEHVQSFTFETIARTHRTGITPTYYVQLPWLDYGIHALQLYTKGKITPTAVGQYLTLARDAKLKYETRLKTLGKPYGVEVVCLSPFDNLLSDGIATVLFGDSASLSTSTTTTQIDEEGGDLDPFLEDERIGTLFIRHFIPTVGPSQQVPESGDAEYALVQSLLPKLKDMQAASNLKLAATWQDVLASQDETHIKTIDDLFHLANAAFVLYSNRATQGHVCSLLPLSEFSIYKQTDKFAQTADIASRLAKVDIPNVLAALQHLPLQPQSEEKTRVVELLGGQFSLSDADLALVKVLLAFRNRAQLLQQTTLPLTAEALKALRTVLNKTITTLTDPCPSKGLRPFLEEHGIGLSSSLSRELGELLGQTRQIQKTCLVPAPGDTQELCKHLSALGQALTDWQQKLLQHLHSEYQRAFAFCQIQTEHAAQHGQYRPMCCLITVDPVVTVGEVPNMFNAKDIGEAGLIAFMKATLTTLRQNIARRAQGREPVPLQFSAKTVPSETTQLVVSVSNAKPSHVVAPHATSAQENSVWSRFSRFVDMIFSVRQQQHSVNARDVNTAATCYRIK